MDIDFQSIGMEQGRCSRRLAPVQSEAVEPHVQGPPFDMEVAQFDARSGRLFKLPHDRAPRPQVRKPAPDDADQWKGVAGKLKELKR